MACPWAKIEKPEPVNLMDIMSEEVAKDLQAKEDKRHLPDEFTTFKNDVTLSEATALPEDIPADVLRALSGETCDSDAMIAQNLQLQFDKEYDDELKRIEQIYNGSSKVSISFDNYRRAPLNVDFESDLEDEEVPDILDRKHWDRFDDVNLMPPKTVRMQDGKMVTKHDTVMNGRKNACKLLSFPPEFQTGDGETFDLKLSNKVFNSLKTYSKQEQVRRYKVHDKKDQATAEFGLDSYTRLILYKMINNQLLEQVNGIISIGKEAVILHADSDPSFPHQPEEGLPKECAIKVFKTTLSEFKQRDKYIKDDYRFKNRIGNQTTAKIIQIWAEKEMANLMRLQKVGIPCPKVVTLKHHVLVMSFIGDNHCPAPKLKDAHLSNADYIQAYDEIIQTMKKMYEEAHLIHSDLSEYNILWYNHQCYFIDVSQSVEPSHENAFHFLHRDCVNITKYFNKKNVPEVYDPDDLFIYITGCDFNNKIILTEIREGFKMKPHLVDKPGFESTHNFDAVWEKVEANEIPIEDKTIAPEVDLNLIEPPKA